MMATEKNKLSIYFHSAINCLTERSLLGAFEKQNENYERGDHDVFNSAGSTLATPILVQRMGSTSLVSF